MPLGSLKYFCRVGRSRILFIQSLRLSCSMIVGSNTVYLSIVSKSRKSVPVMLSPEVLIIVEIEIIGISKPELK